MTNTCQKRKYEGFEIELSDTISAIEADWERLEAHGLLTPFQTRAWLLPFYKKLAPHLRVQPLFVCVRDSSSRQPVMLFLLCMRRKHGLTFIEFPDYGVSDYNAPLIAPTFNYLTLPWANIWQNILDLLATRGSILQLKKIPARILSHPNPLAHKIKNLSVMDLTYWGFSLPASAEDYSAHILQPSFAKELAKKFRRVASRGELTYIAAQTPEEKRKVFDVLVRQRQARFRQMGWSNVLDHPVYRSFYEAAAITPGEHLVHLGMLKVGDDIVGALLSLNRQETTHVLMSTYQDGEWKSCSLGNVLIRSAIDHAIERGDAYFDLTIGNEAYKQLFGATSSPLYSILQPLTKASFCITFLKTLYRHLRNNAKLIQQKLNHAPSGQLRKER